MGIIVTALILIISRINTPASVSDAEIISRARELGMIESGDQTLTEATESEGYVSPVVLPDEEPETQPSVQSDPESDPETISEHETDPVTESESEPEPEPVVEPEPEPVVEPEPEPEPVVEPEPEPEPGPAAGTYVTLTVYSGNSSDTVANRAKELGLVTDAKDFDNYLVRNGYANRIRVGSFQIPVGASYETIAKAIT